MKLMKTCLTALISSLMIFSPMAYADKWSDQFPHIKATAVSYTHLRAHET